MYSSLEASTIPNVILPYGNQRLDGEGTTHLPETELKEVIDAVYFCFYNNVQTDEGKKRLDNTLVGRIVDVLRKSSNEY